MRPTVCLSMIVKDEASVIRRCLDSVKGLIDHWVIVDTGSTDGTQEVIRKHMAALGIPGALFEREWVDFATNRTGALRLAQHNADYSLLIDADDVLEVAADFVMPPLVADCYRLNFHDGNITYQRPCLVRNALPWRYRGVLHEFLTGASGDGPAMPGLAIRRTHDGARARNPDKYRLDAELLERALLDERDPLLVSRYWFYLGQSWRDAREKEKSIGAYLHRATLGGWSEEVCVSLYTAARLSRDIGRPADQVLDLFVQSFAAAPMRAEGLHGAATVCRAQNRFSDGYHFAKTGLSITQPSNGLFVEPWVYQFGLADELAVCGYHADYQRQSLMACIDLLDSGRCPANDVPRVYDNAQHALRRIRERANLAI